MRGLILFDLDGTLMDSAPGLAHSANFLRTRADLRRFPTKHSENIADAVRQG